LAPTRLKLSFDRLRGPLVALLALAAGAGIWQYLGTTIPKTEFVGFTATMSSLWHMLTSGELPHALKESLEVFGLGLGIAFVIGFFAGLLMARIPALRIALDPYVTAFYAMPGVALIPFILAVVGFELKAKVVVVVLFGIWPILINTLEGARSVNPELLEVAASYRSSEPKLWTHVIVPYTLPYTMTGVRQSIARCLVGMIAAEFLLSSSGLGNIIYTSSERFETGKVLASIFTITILATALIGLGRALENYFARWRSGS
jgi:NitT/TauT family transport system permease protein